MPLLNQHERPGRTHFTILLLSWAGWVFDFYDLILYTFLIIPIKEELGLTDIESSLVLGSSLAATAIGGILFGWLSDRYGRKVVLQWTILTFSIGTFLSGFTQGLFALVCFRIITGLGVGGEWGTGQTFICETFPAKVRGRYGAMMQTGAPIGIALAAVVGGYLMPVIGWRATFWVSILPALLVVYIRKNIPESDVWLENKRLGAKARQLPGARFSQFSLLFKEPHRKIFLLCLVLAIFDMSAYWFTYSWMPGYLQRERSFSLARSTLFVLTTQCGGLLGYLTFGLIADKLGRRPAYSAYSIIMAGGLLMITLFWSLIEKNSQLILLFMFLVGFGTGMFGGYGPLFSELFPTHLRGTAMGTAFNTARGIQFFTPLIIAMVAPLYGLAGGISLAALFAILTGTWVWTLPETKGKKIIVEEELKSAFKKTL